MLDPQPFTTLWASTACYRDTFIFFFTFYERLLASEGGLPSMELVCETTLMTTERLVEPHVFGNDSSFIGGTARTDRL
jgi:hypothetical protein